jgi:hypothetical protein
MGAPGNSSGCHTPKETEKKEEAALKPDGENLLPFLLSFHRKPEHHHVIMKQIVISLSLAFSIMAARADLVLQQNVESSMINGTITTQIKGDKIRVDMPSSPQGAMSTIMDLSSGIPPRFFMSGRWR